ncbi:hypothetical protein [Planctomyces sp. SH-PL14]|uniref:hypothetical protein n=1 Tax=Planctomyces sp. SH-PL14 TaxID=1632864 RepID=UPI0009464019|nr:hypothetical protein [Planctomyces sp. SH-PL14]
MDEPSEAIRLFIQAYVDSIDFLRVLLVMARSPERDWTEAEVASATALALDICRLQLEKVSARGLASRTDSPEGKYRYGPRADELRRLVQELIALDDHYPVTLIKLVYGRPTTPSQAAQAFSDAFRLRRP